MTDTTTEAVDTLGTDAELEESYQVDEQGIAYSSESAPSADAPQIGRAHV